MKATLLVSLLFFPAVSAAAFTNAVTADSFVRALAPSANYGGAGALSVSGANSKNGSGVLNGVFDTFIRFNTAAMITNFDSLFGVGDWAISAAQLRVTELGAPANQLFNRGVGAFQIRWISNDSWIEGSGTPNAPAATGIAYQEEGALLNSSSDSALGVFTNGGTDGTRLFPLTLSTPFVDDLAAGAEIGLFLTALDSGTGFTFDSSSFGTLTARPVLEVTALPRPRISNIILSGTDITLTVTNFADGSFQSFSSTNIIRPLSQWELVTTNFVSSSGGVLTLTNSLDPHQTGRRFYILHINP